MMNAGLREMAKILLVEDTESIRDTVHNLLTGEQHVVDSCVDGGDAEFFLQTYRYDLVILDWQLPGVSGVEVCRSFRANGGNTPVLMLTGMTSVSSKEEGLDSGADDYLTKPFEFRELLARVRALLRRTPAMADSVLSGRGIVLDTMRLKVTVNGQEVSLLPKEFQVLEILMKRPNRVLSSDELINHVWPAETDATDNALRSAMKRLRKKVDPTGEIIDNVRGMGYVFRV